ncbi:hypothetical protein [Novosphingobium sp. 32-60-15]|uniref:hypothetical protein n=1 Tax=Novosphingobium sp. 32-60-15 TaxID=1970410 RepID=UPI0025FC7084|nr:hypothetical protein [Novosphingobium sp. 32-60-15]
MKISILVANFEGARSITLHDTEAAASRALMAFVELHWAIRFDKEFIEMPSCETERLRQFFADDRHSYIIAEADLSQLEEHIDTARSLAPRLADRSGSDP